MMWKELYHNSAIWHSLFSW